MPIGDTGNPYGNMALGAAENFALQQAVTQLLNFSIPGLGLLIGWGLGGFKNPFHQPSQAQGTFGFSGDTGGFEDSAKVTDPTWGNVGFKDVGTQYFSGQTALPFDQQIVSMLNQMTKGATPAQVAKIRSDLQGMNFGTETGGYTTQQFLQKFAPTIEQQIQGVVKADYPGAPNVGLAPATTAQPAQNILNILGQLGQSKQAPTPLPEFNTQSFG